MHFPTSSPFVGLCPQQCQCGHWCGAAGWQRERARSPLRRAMLFADKRALQTNLKVSLLEIREKELNFYTNNCLTIGVQASLLAGFASTALMTPVSRTPLALHVVYLAFSVISLSMQLLTVVSTTLLAMLAPGLALRGPDGSMNAAVDSMIGEYRLAFFSFVLGLLSLHGSLVCYAWLEEGLTQTNSIVLTVSVVVSFWMILRYIRKVLQRYQLPGQMVTGKFEAQEAVATGAEAGIVDRGEIGTLSALINQEQHLRSQVDAAARSAAGVGASTSRPGALHTERLARQHEPAAPADEEIVD